MCTFLLAFLHALLLFTIKKSSLTWTSLDAGNYALSICKYILYYTTSVLCPCEFKLKQLWRRKCCEFVNVSSLTVESTDVGGVLSQENQPFASESFCCNTKYALRYLEKHVAFLTALKKGLTLPTPLLNSDQWTSQTHTHTHTHIHTHTPCRQLRILPTDYQRLGIHSVFALHSLPGCSFIIHPSSEKHLKWLCFSFSPLFFSYLISPSCSRSIWLDGTKVNHESLFCFRFVSFSLRKLRCSAPCALVGDPICNATWFLLLLLELASLEVKRCTEREREGEERQGFDSGDFAHKSSSCC